MNNSIHHPTSCIHSRLANEVNLHMLVYTFAVSSRKYIMLYILTTLQCSKCCIIARLHHPYIDMQSTDSLIKDGAGQSQ